MEKLVEIVAKFIVATFFTAFIALWADVVFKVNDRKWFLGLGKYLETGEGIVISFVVGLLVVCSIIILISRSRRY